VGVEKENEESLCPSYQSAHSFLVVSLVVVAENELCQNLLYVRDSNDIGKTANTIRSLGRGHHQNQPLQQLGNHQ